MTIFAFLVANFEVENGKNADDSYQVESEQVKSFLFLSLSSPDPLLA